MTEPKDGQESTNLSRDNEAQDVTRRDWAKVLGALVGVGALTAGCESQNGDQAPGDLGLATSAISAGSVAVLGSTAALGLSSAIGSASFKVAITTGFATPNDGGGGVWTWSLKLPNGSNVTSTTQGNVGTVVFPTGQTSNYGVWLRVYSGPLNVKWFGAMGDGSTPDDMALKLAISAVRQTYYSHSPFGVFFPATPNGYKLTQTLTLNDLMNVSIKFEAPVVFDRTDTTVASSTWTSRHQLKWFGPDGAPAVLLTGSCIGMSIENMSIDCLPYGQTNRAICGIAFGDFNGVADLKKFIRTSHISIANGRFGAWFGANLVHSSDVAHHDHSVWHVEGCRDSGIMVDSGNAAGIVFTSSAFLNNGASPTTDSFNLLGQGSNVNLRSGHLHLLGCASGGTPKSADILQTSGSMHLNHHWSESVGIAYLQTGLTETSMVKALRHWGNLTNADPDPNKNTPTSISVQRNTVIDGCFTFGDVVCNSSQGGSITVIGHQFWNPDPASLASLRPLGVGTFKGDIVTRYKGLMSLNNRGNSAQMLLGGGTRSLTEVGANPPQILSIGADFGADVQACILQALSSAPGGSGMQMSPINPSNGSFEFDVNCYWSDASHLKAHAVGPGWRIIIGGTGSTAGISILQYCFPDVINPVPYSSFARPVSLVTGGDIGTATQFALAFPQMSSDPSWSSGNWWLGSMYFNTTLGALRVNVGGNTWKTVSAS